MVIPVHQLIVFQVQIRTGLLRLQVALHLQGQSLRLLRLLLLRIQAAELHGLMDEKAAW